MYEMRRIKKLMAAVLIRAIRDVYASDEFISQEAAGWLQENSLDFVNRYGLSIAQYRLADWLKNGFDERFINLDIKVSTVKK